MEVHPTLAQNATLRPPRPLMPVHQRATREIEPYVAVESERRPPQAKRGVPSVLWERAKRVYAGERNGQSQLGLRFFILLCYYPYYITQERQ